MERAGLVRPLSQTLAGWIPQVGRSDRLFCFFQIILGQISFHHQHWAQRDCMDSTYMCRLTNPPSPSATTFFPHWRGKVYWNFCSGPFSLLIPFFFINFALNLVNTSSPCYPRISIFPLKSASFLVCLRCWKELPASLDMVRGFVTSGNRILSTQLAPAGAVQVERKLFSVQTNLHTNIILQSSKSGWWIRIKVFPPTTTIMYTQPTKSILPQGYFKHHCCVKHQKTL